MKNSHNKSNSKFLTPTKTIGTGAMTMSGVGLAEIAILGAAGFVLWKNRSRIFNLLEQNGIEVPKALQGNFSSLIQTGVSYFTGNKPSGGRTQMHDA